MFYESVPNGVSYEQLLKVIQQRTPEERPYDDRLYLVKLTNDLCEHVRKVQTDIGKRNRSSEAGN